jgi:hypothetical protein
MESLTVWPRWRLASAGRRATRVICPFVVLGRNVESARCLATLEGLGRNDGGRVTVQMGTRDGERIAGPNLARLRAGQCLAGRGGLGRSGLCRVVFDLEVPAARGAPTWKVVQRSIDALVRELRVSAPPTPQTNTSDPRTTAWRLTA